MITPLLTVVSQNSSCFGKVLRRFVDVVVRLTHDFCEERATCGGVIISDWWTSDTATSIAHPCVDVTARMPWKSLERSRSSRGAWDISALTSESETNHWKFFSRPIFKPKRISYRLSTWKLCVSFHIGSVREFWQRGGGWLFVKECVRNLLMSPLRYASVWMRIVLSVFFNG